jgi:hypothetical protein
MTAKKVFPFESFNWNVEATEIPPLRNRRFRRSNAADRTFGVHECIAAQSTTTVYHSPTVPHHSRRSQRNEEQRDEYEEHQPSNLGG